MAIDLYTKSVLTVIAIALTSIAIQNYTVPAQAFSDCGLALPCAVTVVNTVDIDGSVDIVGSVHVYGEMSTY